MSDKTKDVLVRAIKTFWQAALASTVVAAPEIVKMLSNGEGWNAVKPAIISFGIGAVAAGLSAAYNSIFMPKSQNTTTEDDSEDKPDGDNTKY